MSRGAGWRRVLLAGLLAAALTPTGAAAVPNPATLYCRDLGYEWAPRKTPAGVVGECVLPDGAAVEEWAFLAGAAAPEWGYCARLGLPTARLEGRRQCHAVFLRDCAACVLPDGRALEASTLLARGGPTGLAATTLTAAPAAPAPERGGCGHGAPTPVGLALALAQRLGRRRR
jgi:hypothetical protein